MTSSQIDGIDKPSILVSATFLNMSLWQKLTGHDDDEPKAVATEQSGHPKDLPPPVPVTEHKASTSSGKESGWHDKVTCLLQTLELDKTERDRL